MAEQIAINELCRKLTPRLISTRHWSDASFINLPLVYPSGSFVTVRLTYVGDGIQVSDSGFAYREAESFGAMRSFYRIASGIAKTFEIEHDKRTVFVNVQNHEVERAIYDVSAASKMIADKIIKDASNESDVI